MSAQENVFIGVGGTVLALHPSTGHEIWRAKLKGHDFVNVALLDGKLLATTKGEMFALDPASGAVLWRNQLKGLGWGYVTIAGAGQVPAADALRRARQGAAAAAGAG